MHDKSTTTNFHNQLKFQYSEQISSVLTIFENYLWWFKPVFLRWEHGKS